MVLCIEHVVLTFESVDQILWCYHSNETSLTELLYGTIYSFGSVTFFSENFFVWPLLGTKRKNGASACSTPIPSGHCQVSYVVHRSLESMKLPLTQTYFLKFLSSL